MWLVLILFFTLSAGAQTFLGPDQIACEGQVSYRLVMHSGKTQSKPRGEIRLKIRQIAAIEFVDQNKRLAKLYPADGLDGVVFDKKFLHLKTDERTYWELYSSEGKSTRLVRCEVNR